MSVDTDFPPDYKPLTIPVGAGYQPVTANTGVTVVTSQPMPSRIIAAEKPPNYLGLSLFTCLCCCWIIGIIALVFSLQVWETVTLEVDSAWSAGDVNGARSASENARKLNISGIVCGSVTTGVCVVLFIIGEILRAGGDSDDDNE